MIYYGGYDENNNHHAMIYLGEFKSENDIKSKDGTTVNFNKYCNPGTSDVNITDGAYFRIYSEKGTKASVPNREGYDYWTIDVNGSGHSLRVENYNWSAKPSGNSNTIKNIKSFLNFF